MDTSQTCIWTFVAAFLLLSGLVTWYVAVPQGHWAPGRERHELAPNPNPTGVPLLPRERADLAEYLYYQNDIYFYEDNKLSRLNGADAATFSVYAAEPVYAKDKAKVYFFGKPVAGADLRTFAPISTSSAVWYSRDRSKVYCAIGSSPISGLAGSDPKSFLVMFMLKTDQSNQTYAINYAKDAHQVYWNCEIVKQASPDSFELLFDKGGRFTGYSRDTHHVYYVDSTSAISNFPTSFRVVDGYWAASDELDIHPNVGFDGRQCFGGSTPIEISNCER